MKCKLLHLFDDYMNLYGEYANVALLARFLRDCGCEVQVDGLSLYEAKDISGYDFYFMGAGTERNQKLALEQLRPYRQMLQTAIDDNKVVLFTGNSFELLGSRITDANGTVFEGLKLFDFETVETNRRITGDVLAETELFPDVLVGFMNKCSVTGKIPAPFCKTLMGFGNGREPDEEGFHVGNTIGTHITGPILVKNPALLRYIAGLLGVKNPSAVAYPYMENGYYTTELELRKRLDAKKTNTP